MNILDNFSLKGKTAVITGGSGLFGRQMVQALAQAGATVYTVSRKLESNEALAATLREQGYDVHAGQLDQSKEDSILAFLDSVTAEGKTIDILVNNSVLRPMKKSMDDDISAFEESMKVNATGLFAISRAFGEHMAKNGGGSIINIGSYMGLLGPNDTLYREDDMGMPSPDYFFHKGGMVNFTRYMAAYYGPKNVRCNVLNLGGFFNNQPKNFLKHYYDKTFLKRMANDTDIMGAIIFFASDASAYITGASLAIDGGYTAK